MGQLLDGLQCRLDRAGVRLEWHQFEVFEFDVAPGFVQPGLKLVLDRRVFDGNVAIVLPVHDQVGVSDDGRALGVDVELADVRLSRGQRATWREHQPARPWITPTQRHEALFIDLVGSAAFYTFLGIAQAFDDRVRGPGTRERPLASILADALDRLLIGQVVLDAPAGRGKQAR